MSGWLRQFVAMTALLSCGFFVSPMVFAQTSYQFDLPEQPLADSLRAIGRQTDMNIVFEPEAVKGIRGVAVHGQFTADEAIRLVLVGTSLQAQHTAPSNVVVKPKHAPSSSADSSSTEFEGKLSEIIVTAQKKSERLQDVPVAVTVVQPATLAENGQSRVQDYFATVPGLNLNAAGNGLQTLALRGITTGFTGNPTVGLTIDDVPYGSSTQLGLGSALYPDIDPSDLARIEVLRGPQGTLYGASSMGGLIKFETLDPSTAGLTGRIQVLGETVDHGGQGYAVRGSINVPLSDSLAIRASAFDRRDPGYIENVTTGERDINWTDAYGGHITALWHPSDALSLKIGALLQNTNNNGNSVIDVNAALQPTAGDLKQTGLPGTGGSNIDVRLYTARLEAEFAGLNFVSISGYGTNSWRAPEDYTQSYGYVVPSFQVPGIFGVVAESAVDTDKFTQEFRLSASIGNKIDWILGGFYTHERTSNTQVDTARNSAADPSIGLIVDYDEASSLSEYAGFGDLTAHFTDRFDVQVGARESFDHEVYNETDTGALVTLYGYGPPPYVSPTQKVNGTAFTYLVTPMFKISPDLMIYGRAASGYRLGGLNIEAQLGGVPESYRPDKNNSYEVGFKGDLFDHALTLDASAYYTDWKDIQIQVLGAHAIFTENAGRAKSQGLEFSLQARPMRGMSILATTTWNDAELTQNLPEKAFNVGHAGDQLPYSSRFSANFGVDQEVLHFDGFTGVVGGAASYVGSRLGDFTYIFQTGQSRLSFPAYPTFSLHASLRSASWSANLFANNVASRRGFLGAFPAYNVGGTGYTASVLQPLTIGVSLTRNF